MAVGTHLQAAAGVAVELVAAGNGQAVLRVQVLVFVVAVELAVVLDVLVADTP